MYCHWNVFTHNEINLNGITHEQINYCNKSTKTMWQQDNNNLCVVFWSLSMQQMKPRLIRLHMFVLINRYSYTKKFEFALYKGAPLFNIIDFINMLCYFYAYNYVRHRDMIQHIIMRIIFIFSTFETFVSCINRGVLFMNILRASELFMNYSNQWVIWIITMELLNLKCKWL